MKVGDRVQVLPSEGPSFAGKTGTITSQADQTQYGPNTWSVQFDEPAGIYGRSAAPLYESDLEVIPQTGKSRKTVKTATAKDMVILIAKFLNRRDQEARDLWDVLTALRGPDTNEPDLKMVTTARLRYAMGLRKAEHLSEDSIGDFIYEGPVKFPANKEMRGHFGKHVLAAKEKLEKMGFKV